MELKIEKINFASFFSLFAGARRKKCFFEDEYIFVELCVDIRARVVAMLLTLFCYALSKESD